VHLYQLTTTIGIIKQNLQQNTEQENFTHWIWKSIEELKQLRTIDSIQQWIRQQE